jgi:hypothetical protein
MVGVLLLLLLIGETSANACCGGSQHCPGTYCQNALSSAGHGWQYGNGWQDHGNGNVQYMDRLNINCGGYLINNFGLQRSGNNARYEFKCMTAVTGRASCWRKETPRNHRGGAHYLDRHNVDCGVGNVMSQWNLLNDGSNMYISYHCCSLSFRSASSCRNLDTGWNEKHSKFYYFDRHRLSCDSGSGEALSRFQLVSSGNNYRFDYRCCKVAESGCPAGYYSATGRSSSCATCSSGKYQNQGGQSSCKGCPTGYYQNQAGQSSCMGTSAPTASPTNEPTAAPTNIPTAYPSAAPTAGIGNTRVEWILDPRTPRGAESCDVVCSEATPSRSCSTSSLQILQNDNAAFATAFNLWSPGHCRSWNTGCAGGNNCAQWGSPFIHSANVNDNICWKGNAGSAVASCSQKPVDGHHRRLCPCWM